MKRKIDKLINKILSSKLKLSLFMIVLVVFLLSIGYSAFSSNLNISDLALDVRIQKDIRVTGVKPITVVEPTIDNLCEPVTGEDINYKYVYYDGSDFLIGESTYTTGTKSVGDAYKCQVNESESYIFNIIGQDESGNYNLLLNHNLGQVDGTSIDTILASLTDLTDGWTYLDKRIDSYSSALGSSDGYVSYTFDYTGHYARFIEYSELISFTGGDMWNDNTKPWISSIPKDREAINDNDWKYISSQILTLADNENGFAADGLACGVGSCSGSMTGIRPVITVSENQIK